MGPIAAAIIAGGPGAAALGFFTTLAEASAGAKNWLHWSDAVGPLSGKVLMAVLVLIDLGVLGTFPLFFQAFSG